MYDQVQWREKGPQYEHEVTRREKKPSIYSPLRPRSLAKIFPLPPVTSNLWTHAWSIKCR
jgi:hypothetical protein